MESSDHKFSASFTDRTNVATYYFKHESAESDEGNKHIDNEDSSDSDKGVFNLSLRYSKEEIRDLASQAELMVLNKTGFERKGVKTMMGYNGSCQGNKDTDDSDYGSRLEYDSFISSDPNIALRKMSPTRKLLSSKEKVWRHSLPTSLEFFSPDMGEHIGADQTDSRDNSGEYKTITSDEFRDRRIDKKILPEKNNIMEDNAETHHSDSFRNIASNNLKQTKNYNLEIHKSDSWEERSVFSEHILSSDSDSLNEKQPNKNRMQLRDVQRLITQRPSIGLSSTDDDASNSKHENKRGRKKIKYNQVQQKEENFGQFDSNSILKESRNALLSKFEYIKNSTAGFLKAEEEEDGKRECQENVRKLIKFAAGRNLKSIETLCWEWERLSEQWTELSDQSAVYQALNQAIRNMKQEILVLSSTLPNQELTNYQKQVDTWQNVESVLQKLKQRLFPLNLSVHELHVSVSSSKIKNSSRVSLVSQCKQEVTQLYKLWEEKNNFVATKVQQSRKLLRQQDLRQSANKDVPLTIKKKRKSARGSKNIDSCKCVCQDCNSKRIVKGQNYSHISEIERLKVTMNGMKNKKLINENSYKELMKTIHDLETIKTVKPPLKSTWSWKSITKTYFSSSFLLLTLMSMMYYFCVPKCCDFKYWKISDMFLPKLSYPNGSPPM